MEAVITTGTQGQAAGIRVGDGRYPSCLEGQPPASSPESSVIYNPEGKISQEKLENPAGFWNNVEENTFSLFQNKGA
ncbi:MAG: hypothetical protein ABSH35_32395, partial [Isosphaeraceae bacterium]